MDIRESLVGKDMRQKRKNRIYLSIYVMIILVLLLIIVMNVFVYFNVCIDGVSMYPTVDNGDVVKANRYGMPRRGDIVVIEKIDGDDSYNIVKRIIAMEGDHIEIKDGKVFLNDELLKEKYIKDNPDTQMIDESETWGDVDLIVPENKIFYLGDNRLNSIDSREDGVADISQVKGVIEGWTIATRGIRTFFYNLFLR